MFAISEDLGVTACPRNLTSALAVRTDIGQQLKKIGIKDEPYSTAR